MSLFWNWGLFVESRGSEGGIHILVLCFLLRTNCLFYWHPYLPVARTTDDGEKETQLHFAAESVTVV